MISCVNADDIFRFKSYYVVWKPGSERYFEAAGLEFKSYYVVWKLIIISIGLVIFGLFKSYYVVWKLVIPNNKQNEQEKV